MQLLAETFPFVDDNEVQRLANSETPQLYPNTSYKCIPILKKSVSGGNFVKETLAYR